MPRRTPIGDIIGAFLFAPLGGYFALATLAALYGIASRTATVTGALSDAYMTGMVQAMFGTPIAYLVQGLLMLALGPIPPEGRRGILLTGALGGGAGIFVMLLGTAVLNPGVAARAFAANALYGAILGGFSGLLYAAILAPRPAMTAG